jgi:D-alanyl-D-alanine carboxypeptidase
VLPNTFQQCPITNEAFTNSQPKMRFQTTLAIIVLAASGGACGSASPTAPDVSAAPVDLKASLSTAFDAFTIPGGAACSISINRQGEVLLERGRGEVAPGRPADGNSLYRIASLTKPITASALLISEKAGRLSRSDKLSKFRAYPDPAPTLDELVKHIPGLSNYTDTLAWQTSRNSPTTVEFLLSLVQPWDGIKRYQYSNSHAIYTGWVLEQVNGLRYEDVVQRDIFGPAGMSRSSFAIPPASESAGYPFPSQTHPTWVYAAGGFTSTAADMTRFLQALVNDQFGFGAVESFDRSAGVTSFGMGSGFAGGDLRFTHSGGLDSYSSFNVIFPADRSSVVILCNFNNGTTGLSNLMTTIRSIMLSAK